MINRRQLLVLGGIAAGACLLGTPGDLLAAGDTGSVDVGVPSDFAAGVCDKFAKPGGVFVFRTGSKLYATSAYCTHRRTLLKVADGQIRCTAHGSRFDNDGHATKGPATATLPRYAISLNPQGRLIVDKSKQFDEKHWDDPAASFTVK